MRPLVAPVTYQGGKQRIAEALLGYMRPEDSECFYDLCCGSGAVSVALVNRGYEPSRIVMLDKGPWGMFWKAVGEGCFDTDRFARVCQRLPRDAREIKPAIQAIFDAPVGDDAVYEFLLLQATTIGGAAVWIENGRRRRGGGFRDYWLPTATSSRRSPVNPMMPMPDTIIERVNAVCASMRGVRGVCCNVMDFSLTEEGTIYIDPPYQRTTAYEHTLDVLRCVDKLGRPCWVSEGRALGEGAVRVAEQRSKGGMVGTRKGAGNEEWLSLVPCATGRVCVQ